MMKSIPLSLVLLGSIASSYFFVLVGVLNGGNPQTLLDHGEQQQQQQDQVYLRKNSMANDRAATRVGGVAVDAVTVTRPQSNNQYSRKENDEKEEEDCLFRVLGQMPQQRICPTLNTSILYGEVFPISCLDSSALVIDCEGHNVSTMIVFKNHTITGDNEHRNRKENNNENSNRNSNSMQLNPWFHKCRQPHVYESLWMPFEWNFYQLIDQSQRLCGWRPMYCEVPVNPATTPGAADSKTTWRPSQNCTYDDLKLPLHSIARRIGDACKASSNPQHDYHNIFQQVVRKMVKERLSPSLFQQPMGNNTTSTTLPDLPGPTDLVIHLRMGDVVDQSMYSVQEILDAPRVFYPDTSSRTVYAKPLSYYDSVIPQNILTSARTVHLVGGTHGGWSSSSSLNSKNDSNHQHRVLPIKSCMYIHALQSYLQTQRNVSSVQLRLGNTPDDDVLFISQSKWFIPSGGGFSRVMAQLVQDFGGTVFYALYREE